MEKLTDRALLVENYALAHRAWLDTKEPDEVKAITFNMCLLFARTLTDEQLVSGISTLKSEMEGGVGWKN